MKTCKEVVEYLMSYLEGELSPAEREVFERHLAMCPPCVAYLRTYEATIKAGKQACCSNPALEHVPDELIKAILAARNIPPPQA